MSRLNYREVRDRFTHIDAELVRAHCILGAEGSEYVVRFYPWWEHPAYLEARARDLPWAFEEHPRARGTFLCFPCDRLLSSWLKLPYVTRAVLYAYLNPLTPYRAPYSLGHFPTTLYRVLREVLAGMGTCLFISREPADRALPALLVLNGDDYIVAEDFEVDVPEFEHRDTWFRPDLDARRRE